MFDTDIILVKQILQTIERIFEYTANFNNPDDFIADYKTFDATLMNFVALGESVGKISEQFRDNHKSIDWRNIYAFRNIIAHNYFGVDDEEVFDIIKNHLPKLQTDLLKFISA